MINICCLAGPVLEVGRAGFSAHRLASGHRGYPSHSGSGGDVLAGPTCWDEETLLSWVSLK